MLYVLVLSTAVMLPAVGLLTFFLLRATRRLHAFDKRLAVSRTEALKLISDDSAGGAREGETGDLFREITLAVIRGASVLAPFGAKERDKLAKMLRTAGFRQPDALSIFLAVKVVTAIVAGSAASFVAAGSEMVGQYVAAVVFVFFGGAVVASLIPETVIRARCSARSQAMSEALPNALDLLVMCLEAGLTFERSLMTTAEELAALEPGLASELRTLEAELRLGTNHRTVLQDFQLRTDVVGLQDLATTLLQSERYGTPLTQAMRNIAESERLQRAARIEERTERLPVLMTLPMMLLVLPGTILLMAGPAFLQATTAMKTIGG